MSNVANTFIGYNAGTLNSSELNNTYIGNDAGILNNSSLSNIFIGGDAGLENTFLGFANPPDELFMGGVVGYESKGHHCCVMGYNCDSIGDHNTVIGKNNKVTGKNNVIMGKDITYEGDDSLVIGAGANLKKVIIGKTNLQDIFDRLEKLEGMVTTLWYAPNGPGYQQGRVEFERARDGETEGAPSAPQYESDGEEGALG